MTITEESKLTKKQTKPIAGIDYTERGQKYRIVPEIRFDDDCGNGHNTFSITADIRRYTSTGRLVEDSGGCLHEDIAKHFPHLAKYIKWHLCSTDGPMHYVANAVYLAGNRDHNGLTKGQPNPRSMEIQIQFGDNPIKHKYRQSFMRWLEEHRAGVGSEFDFEVIRYDHEDRAGETHKFAPKYTYGGYAEKWHECPFDTESEALDFLTALKTCAPKFVKTITAWGQGRERDLQGARNAAIWPDATDAELSVEPEELKKVLAARLPKLLAEFRADMVELGFTW